MFFVQGLGNSDPNDLDANIASSSSTAAAASTAAAMDSLLPSAAATAEETDPLSRGDDDHILAESQQQQREITQTDHLNKRLLEAFLARINKPNSDVPITSMSTVDGDSAGEAGEVGSENNAAAAAAASADVAAVDAAADAAVAAAAAAMGLVSDPFSKFASSINYYGDNDDDDEEEESDMESIEVAEMRFVREPLAITSDPISASRYPMDMFQINSAEDIQRLAELYRDSKLGVDSKGGDEDADGDGDGDGKVEKLGGGSAARAKDE